MNICICMAESLHIHLKLSHHCLLMGYAPIQNKFLKNDCPPYEILEHTCSPHQQFIELDIWQQLPTAPQPSLLLPFSFSSPAWVLSTGYKSAPPRNLVHSYLEILRSVFPLLTPTFPQNHVVIALILLISTCSRKIQRSVFLVMEIISPCLGNSFTISICPYDQSNPLRFIIPTKTLLKVKEAILTIMPASKTDIKLSCPDK